MTPLELLRDAAAKRAVLERYANDIQMHDHLAEMLDLIGVDPGWNLRAMSLLGRAWKAERDDPEPEEEG